VKDNEKNDQLLVKMIEEMDKRETDSDHIRSRAVAAGKAHCICGCKYMSGG